MIAFVADENFNHRIVKGLRRVISSIDIVRVQDIGLRTASDEVVLDWAAANERILLTHDVATIPHVAALRLAGGLAMPGIIIVPRHLPIGSAIDEISVVAECVTAEQIAGQIEYVPLG